MVDLLRTQRRRTGAEPPPILLEGGALLDRAELHSKTDAGADIDIGRGKAVADEIFAFARRLLPARSRILEAAATHHSLAPLRHDETRRFVGPRRLDRTGGKEQPAIIGPAQTIAWRRPKVSLRKHVGKVSADRRCLSDHDIAMPDGRHFPHRVDREIGCPLHRRVVVEQLGAVGCPIPLASTGRFGRVTWMSIEDELIGHLVIPTGHTRTPDGARILIGPLQRPRPQCSTDRLCPAPGDDASLPLAKTGPNKHPRILLLHRVLRSARCPKD